MERKFQKGKYALINCIEKSFIMAQVLQNWLFKMKIYFLKLYFLIPVFFYIHFQRIS